VADLNADDVVFVGVEIRLSTERVTADFELSNSCRRIGERPLANVNQDVLQLGGFGKLTARNDA
jgi:hypothetical protein